MVWTNISPEKCFTNKHKKRCLIFLNMREMQIKTTMRYNYITIKMTLKKMRIPIIVQSNGISLTLVIEMKNGTASLENN